MLKAVIFDLDDTLYEEMQFVRSGFKAVAECIEGKNKVDKNIVYQKLLEVLKVYGRGNTFDIALKELDIFTDGFVSELVKVYRSHTPVLTLVAGAEDLLKALKERGYKLSIITDGDIGVQKKKVEALRIKDFFDCLVFSDEYGVDKQKPSKFPYQKALDVLEVRPQESIYLGDNPYKDFITARKLGIHTIRIMRGQYRSVVLDEEYEADFQIKRLDGILTVLEEIKRSDEKVYSN